MRINYNVSAMLSNNALANNDNLLAKSLERLSSGYKINHAKDNPAGLAMAKRMKAQIAGVKVANQNASDGISVISIADGAMSEMSDILQRINELAIKSANGPHSDSDRELIQDEVTQLKEELTRISETTEYNGQPLLDGTFSLKGYTSKPDIVKVNSYSPEVQAGEYTITNISVTKRQVPETDENGEVVLNSEDKPARYIEIYEAEVKFKNDEPKQTTLKTSYKDELLTISGPDDFEMVLDTSGFIEKQPWNDYDGDNWQNPVNLKQSRTIIPSFGAASLDISITGIGPMRLQIGANEGQVLLVDIPKVGLQNMGLERGDVLTQNNARDTIERVDGAIRFVSAVRGKLGAYQNRLESTTNSLDITEENMTAAYSRLMDVDMAEEMTNYTTYQVLTQAGTSMLAQANERPSQVLQLLQ